MCTREKHWGLDSRQKEGWLDHKKKLPPPNHMGTRPPFPVRLVMPLTACCRFVEEGTLRRNPCFFFFLAFLRPSLPWSFSTSPLRGLNTTYPCLVCSLSPHRAPLSLAYPGLCVGTSCVFVRPKQRARCQMLPCALCRAQCAMGDVCTCNVVMQAPVQVRRADLYQHGTM